MLFGVLPRLRDLSGVLIYCEAALVPAATHDLIQGELAGGVVELHGHQGLLRGV